MDLSLSNIKGEELKSNVELDPEIFEVEPNKKLLAQYVRTYQHNQRQGTVKTKSRSDVSGGGRKPWPQKGTGRARHGSIRSPLWVGGGVVFGPQPRDWSLKLPKKMRKKALFITLSEKVRENGLIVLNKLALSKISTKKIKSILQNLFKDDPQLQKKILLVLPLGEESKRLYFSARNLPNVWCVPVQSLNAYQVLNADRVVMSKESLKLIKETFLNKD